MKAVAEELQEEVKGYTPEEFERWWARSEELQSVLRRLPRKAVINAGMQQRREQLLERWEDLEAPGLGDDEVGSDMVGALRSWIHDSETLVRYIVFTGDTGTVPTTAAPDGEMPGAGASANELPTAPRFAAVESLDSAPAVTEAWHWPWLKGWDDSAKRRRILNPSKKKATSLRRKLMYGLFGVGAVYAGSKYLDE